ncbi:unnamed protein product [Pedinophyceae sp. YPF-701]|nr:unnamed protein product [Pedinophyceae sp. YPF-701]
MILLIALICSLVTFSGAQSAFPLPDTYGAAVAAGTPAWLQLAGTELAGGPSARRSSAVGYDSTNGLLLIFGGTDNGRGAGPCTVLGDTWALDVFALTFASEGVIDPASVRWVEIPGVEGSTAPEPRFSMVSGVSQATGQFVIATGDTKGCNGAEKFVNDVWALDLGRVTALVRQGQTSVSYWTKLAANGADGAPAGRYGGGGGIYPTSSLLVTTHGFDQTTRFSDAFSFDLVSRTWSKLADNVRPYTRDKPHGRCLTAGDMVSPTTYVMYGGCLSGGGTGGPCPSWDGWKFDITDGSWTMLDACPTARSWAGVARLPRISSGLPDAAVVYGGAENEKNVMIQFQESPATEANFLDVASGSWLRTSLPVGGSTSLLKRNSAEMTTVDSVPSGQLAGLKGVIAFGGAVTGGSSSTGLASDVWMMLVPDTWAIPDADTCSAETVRKNKGFSLAALHGVFMALSWGFFLQIGHFVARYCRTKDPLWFHVHRVCQWGGAVLALVGVALVFAGANNITVNWAHAVIGVVVILLMLIQVGVASARPHKDSKRRWMFEAQHWWTGRLALVLALVNCSLGVFVILAPTWAIGLWFGWLGTVVLAYVVAEVFTRVKKLTLTGLWPSMAAPVKAGDEKSTV